MRLEICIFPFVQLEGDVVYLFCSFLVTVSGVILANNDSLLKFYEVGIKLSEWWGYSFLFIKYKKMIFDFFIIVFKKQLYMKYQLYLLINNDYVFTFVRLVELTFLEI